METREERNDEPLTTSELAGRDRDGRGRQAPDAADTTDSLIAADDEPSRPLLPEEEGAELTRRWERIQTGFVDEPRKAVSEADTLVAEAIQQLAASFARERETLEGQWDRGEDVSTEDLRVTLQRYRSFFRRVLSA